MNIERIPVTNGASYSKAVVVRGAGRTVYVSGNIAQIIARPVTFRFARNASLNGICKRTRG